MTPVGLISLYQILLSYFILGAIIKYIDQAYDTSIFSKNKALVLSLPSGLLMGLLIATDTYSSVLLLSIILAVAASKKIDNSAFSLLFITSILTAVTINSALTVSWLPFTLLFLAAIADELGNDWTDKRDKVIPKNTLTNGIYLLLNQRVLMPLTAIILMKLVHSPLYFLYLLSFDLGYKSTEKLSQYFLKV